VVLLVPLLLLLVLFGPGLVFRMLGMDACRKPTHLGLSATTTIGGPNAWQGCSLGCTVGWELTASSSAPGHGFDSGNGWVSGLGGCRSGDVFTFSFPSSRWYTEFWFDSAFRWTRGVSFNGFFVVSGRPGDTDWRRHARPRQLRIWLRDSVVHEVELRDEPTTQQLDLGPHRLYPNDTVRVELADVQCGEDPTAPVALSVLVPLGGH